MNGTTPPLAEPHLFDLPAFGQESIGYISVAEQLMLPFSIQRVYWTYGTPPEISRGRHAHRKLQQVLVAVAGRITIHSELLDERHHQFVLEHPSQALFMPPLAWHWLHFEDNAVLLALTSSPFNELDYIRNHKDFRTLQQQFRQGEL